MSALTVNIIYRDRDGQQFRTYADVTLPTDYENPGTQALTPAMLGFATAPTEVRISGETGGYVVNYDYANQELVARWVDTTVDGAALAEVADTTDLDAVTVRVVATARG
jgi:hypothetical protein